MGRMFRIKNWSRFQHYKDRNPPWIKLHMEILASEDWVMLDDASKLLMLVCMMIAAKHDGHIPDNPDYIRRVSYLSKRPDLRPLIACGFLLPLADASTLQANARPETETETETESILPDTSGVKISGKAYPEDFEAFWKAYPTDKNMPKKLAFRAWQKLTLEKRLAAARAVPGFRSYCDQNKSWYRTVYADRFLSQEKFEGYATADPGVTPEQIEASRDWADQYFKRGKYTEASR